MEAISDILARRQDLTQGFEAVKAEILENAEIQAFIARHQLPDATVNKSLSRFQEYLTAKNAENPLMSGYQAELFMNEGYADVRYQATEAEQARLSQLATKRRVQLYNLPERLKSLRLTDIQPMTKSGVKLYQDLENVLSTYPKARGKYIYGKFGVGKSYMMAALAGELASKGVAVTMLHYPTFVLETTYDNVTQRVTDVKSAPVLILDDIGAEQNNPWIRDSILQVILQHRMDHQLLTFFTSNYSLADLTEHFAQSRNLTDTWPAKRVMERIQFLAEEFYLEGNNRRND